VFGAPRTKLSPMRAGFISLLLVVFLASALTGTAATGRVIKVLPEFLDGQGRTALSPSLYDRDAYQVLLRDHPKRRSGTRFYIQWKAKGPVTAPLEVRVELRGTVHGDLPQRLTLKKALPPKSGWFSHWTRLTLDGEAYKKFGAVVAWRVTLWEGNQLLGQQQSFLW
jgi:hypothetical protein